jgi:hypothetical protein
MIEKMESTNEEEHAPQNVKVNTLKEENDQLQTKLQQQIEEASRKEHELQKLKAALIQKEGQLNVYKYQTAEYSKPEEKVFLKKPVFYGLIGALVLLGALAAFSLLKKEDKRASGIIVYADTKEERALDQADSILMDIEPDAKTSSQATGVENVSEEGKEMPKSELKLPSKPVEKELPRKVMTVRRTSNTPFFTPSAPAKRTTKTRILPSATTIIEAPKGDLAPATTSTKPAVKTGNESSDDPNYVELPPQGKYYVNVSRAYLYDQPDLRTKGYFYMVPSNNSILFSMDEKNGFIYVEFTSSQGLESRGWVKTSDLVKIN